MKKTVITIIVFLILGVAAFFIWKSCSNKEEVLDLDNYTPSKEFKAAADALEQQPEPQYDIEETVRILNGLEVAQSQSEDFMSFLEYMAKQDYSRVPKDVLKAKERLLPILQKMYELQKEYDELDNLWMLARSATSGATEFAEKSNPIGVMSAIFTGNPFDAVNINKNLAEAKTVAFEQYEKDKKLKDSLKKQIEQLHMSYVDYLSEYAPVYFKYMKEWDRLCLDRDKAYLDIYSGRTVDAYNAIEKVLANYPTNREALLLKSLTLIQLAGNKPNNAKKPDDVNLPTPMNITKDVDSVGLKQTDAKLIQADAILDNYMDLYPQRSAPALVLKGLIKLKEGNEAKAMSYFDQASVEYPRQAAALTDLLDSYKNRSYLNKSSEGKYLLKLYRSTMEGYGMFSPNLLKAKYYSQQGDLEKAKEEIFNHFYRRGNQGVYDCLLSDMQYCEENMYSIFKQLLMEQSFIDVSVEPTKNWLLSKNEDEVRVIINNRSDVDLENVRIFLCLHYTDMYKDEYDVVKCPSINIIKHHDKTEIGVVKLNYNDKTYNDITRIRAIAMTDDKICWIDDVEYKYIHAYEASKAKSNNKKKIGVNSRREEFLKDFNIDSNTITEAIAKGITVYSAIKSDDKSFWDNVTNIWAGSDDKLKIELPRMLSLIDPVFSLNQLKDKENAILPVENYLTGNNIRLKFDYKPKEGETIPLYIYSDYISLKVTIKFNKGKPEIKDISVI
ncbi:MAG: hypothetical protein K5874_00640 [Bacteroidaceae bacterium]|nr:hypothetical protein [Bacteroidaceae bacterium]